MLTQGLPLRLSDTESCISTHCATQLILSEPNYICPDIISSEKALRTDLCHPNLKVQIGQRRTIEQQPDRQQPNSLKPPPESDPGTPFQHHS
ncbi:uncharacterized protein B0T23DRAFT_326366 [Neurospora hispaniola]|uniref:Uncharacterized protein n=1 Tax=Neurospora hispaniola TaxID=588809 RepID=A0AAJ0HZG5_9PEZI|nr:hypothetical protein NEUTE2DRAFT_128380 [Neurospora tetrasperma FGSC 2509]KAK3485898.1 hypothetical protein B0T23DRAFT_326366 [Neurospora hispaniola]